jgi:hypothetical protein
MGKRPAPEARPTAAELWNFVIARPWTAKERQHIAIYRKVKRRKFGASGDWRAEGAWDAANTERSFEVRQLAAAFAPASLLAGSRACSKESEN